MIPNSNIIKEEAKIPIILWDSPLPIKSTKKQTISDTIPMLIPPTEGIHCGALCKNCFFKKHKKTEHKAKEMRIVRTGLINICNFSSF